MPRPKTGRVQLGSNPYVSPELYALCHWRAAYLGIPYGKTLDHIHQLAKESSKYYTTQPQPPQNEIKS
tara:strand:- start:194 stop:397 length:204 start_codon:yes stop_codon:yes gene_type:complete